MAEYIDRDALRDALYDADAILMSGIKILNQFPAADVAPVRHGRWVPKRKVYRTPSAKNHTCSECGLEVAELWHYCPNCGAQMDGGVKNG